MFKLDTEIAKLDAFQKGVMPRMDVLVVFGEFAHFNWLPDGERSRSKWDVNGSLRVMEKANEMWKILDGKPVAFDFTVDGMRYKGSHTGILAVRGGKVVVATDGWKMGWKMTNGK